MNDHLLRKYVRLIVEEKESEDLSHKIPKRLEMAKLEKLALYKDDYDYLGSNAYILGLYKPHVLVGNILSSLSDDKKSYDSNIVSEGAFNSILGVIVMAESEDPAWGAWEIKNSAVTGGYGPFMYDVAMSFSPSGTIMSDRHAVSTHARDVYKSYKYSRPDVKKLKLDDIDDPKTPPTEDDAEIWEDPEREFLNYAYKKPNAVNVDELLNNHEETKKWIMKYMKSLGWDDRDIKSLIEETLEIFFMSMYEKVKVENR